MNYYITEDGHLLSTDKEMSNLSQITKEQAKEFAIYAGTHTPNLVKGKLAWTEKLVEPLTKEQTIAAREAAYSARSSKHFEEALRKKYAGDDAGEAEAVALGLTEVAAIQEEFPID